MARWLAASILFIPLLTGSACQALLVFDSTSNANLGDAADESASNVIDASAEGTSIGDANVFGDGSANDASVPGDAHFGDAGSFCKTATGFVYCADFENGPDAASYGLSPVVTNVSTASIFPGVDGSNALVLHRSQAGQSSASMLLSPLGAVRIFEGYLTCSSAVTTDEFQASFVLSNGDEVGVVCKVGRFQGFYQLANGSGFAATANSVPSPAWVRVAVDLTSGTTRIVDEDIGMPAVAADKLEPAMLVLGHPGQRDDDAVTMTFDNILLRP